MNEWTNEFISDSDFVYGYDEETNELMAEIDSYDGIQGLQGTFIPFDVIDDDGDELPF